MNGTTSREPPSRVTLVLLALIVVLLPVQIMTTGSNTVVFQYDKLANALYYAISLLSIALVSCIVVYAFRKFDDFNRSAIYTTIIFTASLGYFLNVQEVPDYLLSAVPLLAGRKIKSDILPVSSLWTTSFRGRFRHFVVIGSKRVGFDKAYIPILPRTYDYLADAGSLPVVRYHNGFDPIRGICLQTTVASGSHLDRIVVASHWAAATSFRRC